MFISFLFNFAYTNNTIKFMTNYLGNVFHLNDYVLSLRRVQLAEIQKKLSEFNLFYKYVRQKCKTLINKGMITIIIIIFK